MSSKNKKVLSIVFKIVILLLAVGFIFQKLSYNQNIENFISLTKAIAPSRLGITLITLFSLMLLNWFIESLKWKYLLERVEKISIWKAVESVFCGLTWAVFTPNRIGEYGGRVFFLSPRKRVIGAISMGVGAVGQMVVTNVIGSLALLWFIGRFLDLNLILFYALTFLVFIFCSFFLLFYFNIRLVDSLLARVKFLKPFRKFFSILARYKKRELGKVFVYCLSRFCVFTTQYYLIIHLLLPDFAAFDIIMMTFILFFVQSALPSLDLLDVGVRTMTATYLFSKLIASQEIAIIAPQQIAIMSATASIWLINLIIPAILGSIFVLKLNFFGKPRN